MITSPPSPSPSPSPAAVGSKCPQAGIEGTDRVAPALSRPTGSGFRVPGSELKEAGSEGSGEGGGGLGEIPTREEVVKWASEWAGDEARGIPAGIPEGYALSWCNWRMGESAPVFPRDWRRDLAWRFVADWVKKRPETRQGGDSQSPIANRQADGRAGQIEALEGALKLEKKPAARERLRGELKKLTG